MKSLRSEEIYNYRKAKTIYDNWEKIKFEEKRKVRLEEEKKKLGVYLSGSEKKGKKGYIEREYYYAKTKPKSSRQMVRGVGLQNLMREIRQTITKDYYYDVDMVNSEPTLLLNYCEKNGYKCESIKYYCEHRDECLKEIIGKYNVSRKTSKEVVLSIINGGACRYDVEWLKEYTKEIREVHKKIMKNPAYSSRIHRIQDSGEKNVVGKMISEILLEIENECLMSCVEYMKKEKICIKRIVLIYDGFMIPKKEVKMGNKWLRRLSKYVCEKTGYEVAYSVKPMEEVLDLEGLEMTDDPIMNCVIANNDNDASEYLLAEMVDQICKCENEVWVYSRSERIYVCEERAVISELVTRCMALHIKKRVGQKYTTYSDNISGARSIATTALEKVRTDVDFKDDDFVKRMIAYTKDKIFYRNGYIRTYPEMEIVNDMGEECVMTPVRISKDIPDLDKISEEDVIEFEQKVLIPIFKKSAVIGNYLAHIARAITGHIEDKDWLIMSGMRNSGKGVLTELNDTTFGCYVGITSANNFLMERMHTTEDPKKYAWLYQMRWKRILHTSEIKIDCGEMGTKMDGNLIKGKLSSGGDPVEVRDLYQKAVRIVPQCRLFMMCNDIPPISPPDALQTVTKIRFPREFIEEDIYDALKTEGKLEGNMMKADITIKDYVRREDISDIYLGLVLKAYRDMKVVNCQVVKEETLELKADMGDERSILDQFFVITKNRNDIIMSHELRDFHENGKIKVSFNKLKDILKSKDGVIEDPHVNKDGSRGTRRGLRGSQIFHRRK